MEPRFTRGEYWLLETVIECEFEVCALVDSNLESFWDKKGHGLTRASLVETFHGDNSHGKIHADHPFGFLFRLYSVLKYRCG